MSDNGRIHRKFWNHDKAKAAGNAALGLWARANSWCRDHRKAGYVPAPDALEMGTQAEIDALVNARLWVKTQHGYRFHDYEHWNDDVEADTLAGDMVREVVPASHPSAIRKQLVRQATALLAEGIDRDIVKRALGLWCAKDLSPSLLPNLASEAMKEAQRSQNVMNVLRDCWRSGKVTPLKQFGYVFTLPDIPDDVDRDVFIHQAKRDWMLRIRERIK
ncbi:Uncharacterised protein [Mycobacteroides abscessus subsp. massiliense]|nr:Uncharacterised protein [Mycobacteroides abscessus subsp. massiliense]